MDTICDSAYTNILMAQFGEQNIYPSLHKKVNTTLIL